MARSRTYLVDLSTPMSIGADGQPTDFKLTLPSTELTAAQIVSALVTGAICFCLTCNDEWEQCPALSKAVHKVLPGIRTEYTALNKAHGVEVTLYA